MNIFWTVCLPPWIWMETRCSGTVGIVWWVGQSRLIIGHVEVEQWCCGSVIYPEEMLMGQCIGLFFQQRLWMLERERSGNAPPTKPRLSSWILNPLMKSVQLHSARSHVNTYMWVILGPILCCMNYFPVHNLPNVKAGLLLLYRVGTAPSVTTGKSQQAWIYCCWYSTKMMLFSN